MGHDSKKKAERRLDKKWGLRSGTLELKGDFNPTPAQAAVFTAQEALRASYPVEKPWSTRYLEYARHEGTENPNAMLRRDENRYPGGRMVGFILWAGARWAEWRELNNRKENDALSQADHDAFDAWLKGYVDEKTRRVIMPAPADLARPR